MHEPAWAQNQEAQEGHSGGRQSWQQGARLKDEQAVGLRPRICGTSHTGTLCAEQPPRTREQGQHGLVSANSLPNEGPQDGAEQLGMEWGALYGEQTGALIVTISLGGLRQVLLLPLPLTS